ncbi:hypothetical protein L1987_60889 [Smallanthus sonchifolius]|uniref:Uncharacterized protein n=1 Tax=Smallanthus sonchifolius TaxID=185202 RepID=A0ACB9D996_9ASTR|nr:hypothetical protein L1987_60889 [Smallanthus sonchifolius]
MAMIEFSFDNLLIKGAVFVIVQALVYLILSNSSDLFSKTKMVRSFSFKPARSVSIRRMFAAIADMPPGGEVSPSSSTRGVPVSSSEDDFSKFE